MHSGEGIVSALKPGLDARHRTAALLHDAPEYVVGDLISPFKAAMGASYKSFEDRIQRAIHIRFGLPPVLPPGVAQIIKRADKIAAYHEAAQLAGFSVADAKACFGDHSALKLPPLCASWSRWKRRRLRPLTLSVSNPSKAKDARRLPMRSDLKAPSAGVLSRLGAIVGEKGALTAPADIDPYLHEGRGLYHGRTPLILRPATVEQVSAILKIAHEERIGIVPQGGNTGLVGGQTHSSWAARSCSASTG